MMKLFASRAYAFSAMALGKNLVYTFVSWNTYQFCYLHSVLFVIRAAAAAACTADADLVLAAASAATPTGNTAKA